MMLQNAEDVALTYFVHHVRHGEVSYIGTSIACRWT